MRKARKKFCNGCTVAMDELTDLLPEAFNASLFFNYFAAFCLPGVIILSFCITILVAVHVDFKLLPNLFAGTFFHKFLGIGGPNSKLCAAIWTVMFLILFGLGFVLLLLWPIMVCLYTASLHFFLTVF